MITQDETEVRSDPGFQLATLIQAREDMVRNLNEAVKEARRDIQRMDDVIYKKKQEILHGQGNLLDVMTEISHERPNGSS